MNTQLKDTGEFNSVGILFKASHPKINKPIINRFTKTEFRTENFAISIFNFPLIFFQMQVNYSPLTVSIETFVSSPKFFIPTTTIVSPSAIPSLTTTL